MTVFEHVIECGAAPVFRGGAFFGRSILEAVAFVCFSIVPAKSTPLEDRVQRIGEDDAARQVETSRPAALAEAANQIVLGQAGQALADQPVHQVQSRRQLHKILCRVIACDERMQDSAGWMRRRVAISPHPEERALARVSKDEKEAFIMVRDAASRLLTMRPTAISRA